MGVVNKVRLLGNDFSDERIVQFFLVSVPERYESEISSLEETKDLSSISLVELVNALQAQEQRRIMRGEASIEGGLYVKAKSPGGGSNNRQNDDIFQPCAHCKKTNHPQIRCWWRSDVKCRKCGNMGHVESMQVKTR